MRFNRSSPGAPDAWILWNRNSSPALSALGDASAFLVRAPQIWSDDESGRSAGHPLQETTDRDLEMKSSRWRATSPKTDPWLTCLSPVPYLALWRTWL